MELAISSVLVAQITAHAAGHAEEVCGLLLGDDRRIAGAVACTNVAADARRRFEIDPAALIAAHRAARAGGPRVIGSYHSHPNGSPIPSACDAAAAMPDGAVWLIVGDGDLRAWRSVEAGAIERRFDPVRLLIACAGESTGSEGPASIGGSR